MSRLDELKLNFEFVLKEEGALAAAKRARVHASRLVRRGKPHDESSDFVDVLFINGCDYCVPQPIRYRVDHQAEQLRAIGMSTRTVNAWELNEDYARIARVFIIFRCPYADIIGDFIKLAHSLNKTVLYDIDDLVIDTAYTDQIPYLSTMSAEERAQYDDGVHRMGQTMLLCDGTITTTDQLAAELRKYVSPVFVNRNVASEEMLMLSDRAVEERDVFPGLDASLVKRRDKHRWKVANERAEKREGFSIGYFSGSITHNADFDLILPAVVRFMKDYEDVKLHVVGELDLPAELEPYSDRVVRVPFSPWRRLPQMISFVDVNLIPLEDTIFNRAKSENKWVEAALVKVPSIASNVGALQDSIANGQDGILCDSVDEWFEALVRLHDDDRLRRHLAEAAYEECKLHHVTCGTGMSLASFICSQMHPNIGFILPGLDISGGVLVAMKHMSLLKEAGYDVTVLDDSDPDAKNAAGGSGRAPLKWIEAEGCRFPVLTTRKSSMCGTFDKMVATMWTTSYFMKYYSYAGKRYYLVQNRETGFYHAGQFEREQASKTYGINPEFTYLTISPWCKNWLKEEFCKDSRYAQNGIDLSLFPQAERDWSGKIRILVEGDSSSKYKNVDESFEIIDKLDPCKYEIWYLSYRGKPKDSYRVDKFFQSVPHDKVGEIYQQCHILVKTSVLESFSYPPLEMMATGGAAVVLANEGNAAYCVDGENCLMFNQGEDDRAASLIEQVVADEALRSRLHDGGIKTAQECSWDNLTEEILALYE